MANDRPKILVVVSTAFPQERFDALRAAEPSADFVAATDNTVLDNAGDINALIGCPRKAFTPELFERAGGTLQWVHGSGAGIEEYLLPEFVVSDIEFTNGKVIQGPEVADHAVALLLALARNLHLILRDDPGRPYPRPLELRGKQALVIGLGGIGLSIAERLAAFGMHVSGTFDGIMPPMLSFLDHTFPPERLHEVLPSADAVLVSAPHTVSTDRMFGRDEFALMKNSAFFVAVSRGKLIHTDALVDALRAGEIQAAGLDVTDPEPLPADHPLRSMRNVIITPHIAGLSDNNRGRSMDLVETNIHRFIHGLPLINPVNKRRGY